MSDQQTPQPVVPSSAAQPTLSTSRFHVVDQLFRTVRWAFGLGVVAYGLHEGRIAVVAFAGANTHFQFDAVLRAFADLRISIFASIAGLTTFWALAERKLRQRTIKRLHPRVETLELALDPKRQSSGLTKAGTTNPQDREL